MDVQTEKRLVRQNAVQSERILVYEATINAFVQSTPKNFIIHASDGMFKIHRELLIGYSTRFAKFLMENPSVDALKLDGMSKDDMSNLIGAIRRGSCFKYIKELVEKFEAAAFLDLR